MKTFEEIAKFVIVFCLGAMASSMAWAIYSPDQPKLDCVPNYSQTGLECCPVDPE